MKHTSLPWVVTSLMPEEKKFRYLFGFWQNCTIFKKPSLILCIQITHISLHPKFEKGFWTSVKNDQILLHLERDVVSSSSIQPICLPQNVASIQANIGTNDSLIMTGWGSYSEQLFLKMDLRSPEDCQDRWKSAGLRDPDRGTVTNDNIKVPYVDRYCAKTSTGKK